MAVIDTIPTLPLAGTLVGTEKVGIIDTDGLPTQTTVAAIANLAGQSDAQFIVATASGGLSAERVATDTATVAWDFATAAQAKASVVAGSIGATQLANALADALVVFTVSAAAEAGDKRVLTIQAKDIQGNNLAVATQFWLYLVSAADASYAVSDDGAGSITFDNTTTKQTLCITDATGLATVGITDTATETIKVAIGSGPGCPFIQGPAVLSLAFAP